MPSLALDPSGLQQQVLVLSASPRLPGRKRWGPSTGGYGLLVPAGSLPVAPAGGSASSGTAQISGDP